MLNLELIRNDPERVCQGIATKHEKADLECVIDLDRRRRLLQKNFDDLRHEQKQAGEAIARARKQGDDAADLIAQMQLISDRCRSIEVELRGIGRDLEEALLTLPNLPAADVPIGKNAKDNEIVREWGAKPEFAFKPKPHWEIGASLGIFDLERAAKIAGSGYILFTGMGARLERALINFMLDLHTEKHGYKEIAPPVLNNRKSMIGTGQLPKLEEDMYRIESDDLFLIPTAEVPLTNIHANEILDNDELPVKYTAYTPCFRREAGAYGKDTRGIVRVHQFDKVEMVKLVAPEYSEAELESLLQNAEAVLQALGFHYRVVKLCTGDLSFAAAKCYDLEVWAPGVGRYLEISSCSNFFDFQARRCKIRFRKEKGAKPEFVHTLNGSGVALARTVVTLLELLQNEDGTVDLPECLGPYMGGQTQLKPA